MQGSQFHRADGYVNDPLPGILGPFMSAAIPTGFGPQDVPYLATVTQLTGTTVASLAAVPTVSLPVPFIVEITINGADQRWQLVAYTGQSGAGTQLPNDFNASTNNKIWVQIS